MARRKENRISVYEPRPHGKKWRIRVRDGADGKVYYKKYRSEEEAWEGFKRLKRESARYHSPPVGEVIAQYKEHLVEKGNKECSIRTTIYRLDSFFSDFIDEPIPTLTREVVTRLYDLRSKSRKTDTHRNELREVKTFFRWCVKKGLLKENLASHVEGVGKRARGKKQLRPSEARLFLDRALDESEKGNDGSFSCAAVLVLGLRPSEIIERVVRDVDVFTKSLFIERAKTEAGDRKVEIPEVLWPHFLSRLKGRQPLDPLLPTEKGGFHHRAFVLENTRRICKALELPRMTAHGLRGSHSTIAQEGGATGHLVAQQLGHANEKVTQDHYTVPGTKERQVRTKALRVLTKRTR